MTDDHQQERQGKPDIDYFVEDKDRHLGMMGLDGLVGTLSFAFNNMETQLIALFGHILGMGGFASQAVWHSTMWSRKLILLNAAFGRREDLKHLTDYWRRLYAFVEELGGERNFIVHGSRKAVHAKNGEVTEYIIANSFFLDLWGFAKRRDDEIDQSELEELILDMQAATIALCNLDTHLCGQGPSLDELNAAAVRRRPSRHRRRSS